MMLGLAGGQDTRERKGEPCAKMRKGATRKMATVCRHDLGIGPNKRRQHGILLARAMSTRASSPNQPQERCKTVHVAMNVGWNENGHHLSPRPWNWTKQRARASCTHGR